MKRQLVETTEEVWVNKQNKMCKRGGGRHEGGVAAGRTKCTDRGEFNSLVCGWGENKSKTGGTEKTEYFVIRFPKEHTERLKHLQPNSPDTPSVE